MNSRPLKPYIELLRPVNAAIVFLTIAVAGLLAKPLAWDWFWVFVASLAGALIAGGGNAINDYFDLEIDKINRPDRPLPRGALPLDKARRLWLYASIIGLILCASLSLWNLAIGVFWVLGLYAYSRYLKGSVLVGNVAVSLMTGLAFLFGAIVVGRADLGLYPGIFAFLANLARELLKDVEDIDGDAQAKLETLPVKHGAGAGLLAVTIVLGVLIVASFLPVVVGVYNYTYLLFILVVDLGLGFVGLSMWYDSTLSNLKRLSLILKISMVGGLFAILLGS